MSRTCDIDKQNINGPLNALRLEGKINNVNKVIYLFGDYHHPISIETKCDSYYNKDFTDYLYQTLTTTDKNIKYDFFYENYANLPYLDQALYSYKPYRVNYLNELRMFVDSEVIFTRKDEKSPIRNGGSNSFSNLRIHFLDIRYFFGSDLIYDQENNVKNCINYLNNNPANLHNVNSMIISFYNIKNHLNYIYSHINLLVFNKKISFTDIINQDDNQLKKFIDEYMAKIIDRKDLTFKYSKKMFQEYNNIDVKNKLLNSNIFKEILTMIKDTVKQINSCLRKLILMKKQIVNTDEFTLYQDNKYVNYGYNNKSLWNIFIKIDKKFMEINDNISCIYVHITDIYLLRRLLDKDYVNNALIYTGIRHTANYVNVLVNQFDFKITHYNYIKDDNVKNLLTYQYELLIYPPKLKQCVNMTKFPDKFL